MDKAQIREKLFTHTVTEKHLSSEYRSIRRRTSFENFDSYLNEDG